MIACAQASRTSERNLVVQIAALAAAAGHGGLRARAGRDAPNSLPPLEPKSPPPPPPPARSSMVSAALKPCSTTSVEYFSTPAWSVYLRVCSWPSR